MKVCKKTLANILKKLLQPYLKRKAKTGCHLIK